MKRLSVLFAFILFATSQMQAQKIAVVDINSILEGMASYKQAQSEIDRISAEWRQQISQEMDVVKSMYNKFQAEQVLLSDEAKKQKEEEIVKKEAEVRELQRAKFGPEGELFSRRQQLVAPIQERVFAAIEAYAAERGFDIIFDKAGSAGLLFVGADYDKTEDVRRKVGK